MTDQEKGAVEKLISRIETAVGQMPDRSGPNGALITEVIQCANGLRSLLGIVRTH